MLDAFDIVEVYSEDAALPAMRAIRFAAGIANQLGARSRIKGHLPAFLQEGFYRHDPPANQAEQTQRHVIYLCASAPAQRAEGASIIVDMESWQTEETLFAASGLSDLLGDPERDPLTPNANYAAHTIGYTVFAALSAIAASLQRFNRPEQAIVSGTGALSWVNWKSAMAGALGQPITRQGEAAEWPVLPCKDGHVAFVYTERDWANVIKMIGDPTLEDECFSSFKGRAEHREDYMHPVREWCAQYTKSELAELFLKWEIPGAPVATVTDLLGDPLLAHRETFEQVRDVTKPKLPHRIEASASGGRPKPDDQGDLPLDGIRILDFGIITAGAGVSALLADMGAEVIKVESPTYPDPFRAWAGAADGDSPLFKSNNRNKKGIALDLKTDEGMSDFLELARTADIVIENFRRGVLDRLGLTFERLCEANPSILLASISGQGLSGPGSGHTTFGSTLEASSGFASLTCYENGLPVISGRNLNYPDQIICLYGAAIIALQAIQCRRDGTARHIDVSQRDCAVYQLGDVIHHVSQGAPDSADAVKAYLKTLSRAAAPSTNTLHRTSSDLASDPTNTNASIFAKSPNGALVKGFPFQLVSQPMTIWGDAPGVGEHTDEILNNLKKASHVD